MRWCSKVTRFTAAGQRKQQRTGPTSANDDCPRHSNNLKPGTVAIGSTTVEAEQCDDGRSSYEGHQYTAKDNRPDRQQTARSRL